MLPSVEASGGAVLVVADGASVRVPVTVTEANAAGLPRPVIAPTLLHRLTVRGGAEPDTDTVPGAPERAMRRVHPAADALPSHRVKFRSRQETRDTAAGDRAALSALYDVTVGDDWWRNKDWLSDRPLGEWYGVTTDADGRVTALELSDNRLVGAVPDVLGSLTRLESLDLSRNALTGSIPAALGELADLSRLHLGLNRLTGAIPSELGNLSNLESLSLNWNEFRTPIPPELGNLTRLELLDLEFSLVTGPIPPTLGNLTSLTLLDLGTTTH